MECDDCWWGRKIFEPRPLPRPARRGEWVSKLRCRFCGAEVEVSADAPFCRLCGRRIIPAPVRCPFCGGEVSAGNPFCRLCGRRIIAAPEPLRVEPPPQRKVGRSGSKAPKIAAFIIIAIVIIGLLASMPDIDLDFDGITNGEERRYGTNPFYPEDWKEDWDGDGINSYDEVQVFQTDPKVAQNWQSTAFIITVVNTLSRIRVFTDSGYYIRYATDEAVYGHEYWQSPAKTLRNRTGDCDDFAILQNYCLEKNGWRSYLLWTVWTDKQGAEQSHASTIFRDKNTQELYLLNYGDIYGPYPNSLECARKVAGIYKGEWLTRYCVVEVLFPRDGDYFQVRITERFNWPWKEVPDDWL